MKHEVAFHAPDKAVVCSCGDYFASQPIGMTWFSDPLAAWADHLRETSGLNLQDAYEQGWRDACDDHLEQRGTAAKPGNPNHPIGARKREHYPRAAAGYETTEVAR